MNDSGAQSLVSVAMAHDRQIQDYWDARIHDTPLTDSPAGSLAFFEALDAYRLRKSAYLTRTIGFEAWAGREVLEIGCGAGLDLMRFARGGARATGIELSATAIALARDYFRAAGQAAALLRGDGAALPFPAASFDLIYCHGVLPFARDPARIIAEAYRVLRAGGEAIFMVYNRHSWIYALAKLGALSLGHADAPGFRTYTRREFERLLAPFPDRRMLAERLPQPAPLHGGAEAGALRRLSARALRALPNPWLRPFGWHLLAFCRKAP